jgi:hypothetical protein
MEPLRQASIVRHGIIGKNMKKNIFMFFIVYLN